MSVNLDEYYNKIYKYCYFKVRNKELAEDLTQESFLKYFGQNTYKSNEKPLAYLYTIAKNLCIDYFRQRRTEPLDENILSDNNQDTILTNWAVVEAVEKLSPEFSEIILLRFGTELGINEISTVLNISRFAVYRKINTALKDLKQMLREEDFYE